MKKYPLEISPRYIVDDLGKRTEVILDIPTFEQMLESLEDSYFGLRAEYALEEGKFIDFDVESLL